MDGGRGLRPRDVGELTLDQAFMLLADRKNLRSQKHNTREMETFGVASLGDKDGNIRGRAADGSPIQGKVVGKSLCQRLLEEEATKRIEEEKKKAASTKKHRRR